MKNQKKDYNQLFALCEDFCKHGSFSPGATGYLPIQYPVWYKIRVAELFAEYKMFPAGIRCNNHFPELGLCIIFIPFTHGLLGWYEKTTNREYKDFMQYRIYHKGLKQQKKIYNYPMK